MITNLVVIPIAARTARQVLKAMIVQLSQKAAKAFVTKEFRTDGFFKKDGNVDPKGSTVREPRNTMLVFRCRQHHMELFGKGHVL
jgi:hypothetical protein